MPDPDMIERYNYLKELVDKFKGKRAIIGSIADISGLLREHLLGDVIILKPYLRIQILSYKRMKCV